MDEMEEKLGAILNNPQLMQQIMGIAQSLGQSQESQGSPEESQAAKPSLDLSMLQKLSGLTHQSGVDREQQALLNALSPFLAKDRLSKLEKAMRAAKMAKLASSFLNAGGLQLLTGR